MTEPITIRLATEANRQRIRELAELDGGHAPNGDVLLAEVQGRLWAAVGVDGVAVADPFEPTADVVGLLRAQVAGNWQRAPRWRGLLGWLRPARSGASARLS